MLLQRIFFLFASISLALNFWYHISISQIGPNPLLNQEVDPVYLLFMYLGIPHFITSWLSPYFDALLVMSCVASFVWPRYKAFPLLFFMLHFVYFITYNMLSGHHFINIGLLVMSAPFIFYRKSRFASVFTLCRFIFCFMMFSAACWKIVRGNLWQVDQTNMLLITTYLQTLVSNKPSAELQIVKWLIHHKYAAHGIWVTLILIEGTFLMGFFNFKWDRLLFAAYLAFFTGGWIIFNIYNFENLLFLITLSPVIAIIAKANRSGSLQTTPPG
jgi:hypothetical protein